MPLITFADKVDSKVTASPIINKIVADDINQLKNGVNSLEPSYTSLVQLLNQTSPNPPVATEVYNDTGEVFTWFYVGAGVFSLTSTNSPFTAGKTVVFFNNGNDLTNNSWRQINAWIIEITTISNDRLINGSFEVRIYN